MGRVYAIGVSGRSCCGKTFFATKISEGFSTSEVILIQQDNYYRDLSDIPLEDRETRNFDRPEAFDLPLLINHLGKLKNGQIVKQPIYDFHEHLRTGECMEIKPVKVLLVEGLLIFHPPELREMLDLRIYLDGDDTECLIRRIRRDVAERGRSYESVLEQYHKTVHPMYLRYVLRTRAHAHLVVPPGGVNGPAVEMVRNMIRYILQGQGSALMEAE